MEQRHLIIVDEQSQAERLIRLMENLKSDGIELIYEEIDPSDCTTRSANGDLLFSLENLKEKLCSIPYLAHVDVFATDYNLIEGELKGIDVIKLLYDCVPYFNKRVVLYSAQIEEVITDIITSQARGFDKQIAFLKLLTRNDIDYLSSDGEFESKFKSLIIKEPDLTIDSRLSNALLSFKNPDFKCTIPNYDHKTINEIGIMLCKRGCQDLKKDIVDHIIAYITSIKGYE